VCSSARSTPTRRRRSTTFFLASAIYTGGTYRITADDLKAFKHWQDARQADPLTAQFRSSFAFNANGAKPTSQDHLTDEAHELERHFTWINHTWDHKDLTTLSYADAFEEFSKNHQYAVGASFTAYSVENLVTPGITGLDNAEVMRAAFDVGIRQLVSDTSVAGQGNPTPNAGYYNAQNPELLVMPRRPLDLYFNVSQPSEWMVEYADRHMGVASTYEQMVGVTSDALARYLLRGENDAWMFHQANLRDIGGGKSLLSDVLDAAFTKYGARSTLPVLSPTMDELAAAVEARMVSGRLRRHRDDRAGREADRAGGERRAGADNGTVYAVRGELRGPAHLVPAAGRGRVDHPVAGG
jgi:hypothetical protein